MNKAIMNKKIMALLHLPVDISNWESLMAYTWKAAKVLDRVILEKTTPNFLGISTAVGGTVRRWEYHVGVIIG